MIFPCVRNKTKFEHTKHVKIIVQMTPKLNAILIKYFVTWIGCLIKQISKYYVNEKCCVNENLAELK